MRAPVSWIRDVVSLPDDVTTEQLAARLTALGLKLEAIERPGHDITGPLVVGRVLSFADEPQSNGKTIRWCSVDVGDANGTGEPQGIVCGAHNFAVGDLVPVILPGGVLPGDFAISARKTYGHVSAGMICSAKELGLGDDHDGIIVLPPDAGQPGDDAFDVLPLRDEVIEFEINPDRAYALSLRGVAREAALAYDVAVRRPGRPAGSVVGRAGVPRRRRRPRRLPGLHGPVGQRLRPDGRHPGLDGPAGPAGRHAADLAGRRRHQLRDARARPADPRLRPRQADRPDRGPARDRGREAHHPRRRRAHAVGRGPPDHRRLRTDRPGRRDGRRDHRAVADHDQHLHRGRALGPASRSSAPRRRHKLPSEAAKRFERGIDPDHPAGRGRPGRRAADPLRRRHGRTRRHAGRRHLRRVRRSSCPPGCPPG